MKNVISLEVLLRWKYFYMGIVSFFEFIFIVEENDFIVEFGLWVCNEVCGLFSEC